EIDAKVITASQSRKSDVITRVTPGIEFGYRSEPFTLLASYDFDAEIFAKNTKLTQPQARQRGGLHFAYQPTRIWTLGFTGEYLETERPQDLNVTTGISGERERSRGYSFLPSFTYRFNPLTSALARYTYSRNESTQAITVDEIATTNETRNDEHEAGIVFERHLTSKDRGSLTYGFRHFISDGALLTNLSGNGHETSSSHLFSLGWVRELSALTTLSLRGGPRFSRGDVAPEVEGALTRRFRRGEASFAYGRTQNIAVGRSGPVETESYLGSLSYQFLSRFTLRANPAYYINNGEDTKTKVYRLDLSGVYSINPWLSLQGIYRFSFERESGPVLRSADRGDRYRNVVFVELTAAPEYRLW
ncbi:MAG: oligogalacturonate-specific porin KdgM family protein, partial [Candidatus Binatia bacterium]